MSKTVVKFGGSSLASAAQIKKAAAIIRSDEARRFVVVSAPGKRDSSDTKVTDLLYRCCDLAAAGEKFDEPLSLIRDRFSGILEELGVTMDLGREIETIRAHLTNGPQREYMASRGEYLNAKVISAYLGFDFLDAANCVVFLEDGSFDAETTNQKLSAAISGSSGVVIPGFYGATGDGTIRTFSRGGSDVTGAIVARAAQADLYENWTDVSGMLAADPRIVPDPRSIHYITYQELRELAYMGASVMHEDAVFPVRKAGIPINIRNTNAPGDEGTMIVPTLPEGYTSQRVTGIAGKTGFSSIHIEKSMMNTQVGFGATLLQILAAHDLPFEHCPTGIDTMSVVVHTDHLDPVRQSVMDEISQRLHPDILKVEDGLAMIAVVGEGMVFSKGTAAGIFQAISDAGINIRMIDQGSSEMNIIIGVQEEDYALAINSIYQSVIKTV